MGNNSIQDNWLYYRNEIRSAINDLKHKDTFYKQIPNLLTITRIIGIIPVSILMFSGNVILGLIILGLVLSTDFFDGYIARKYNLSSKFGADLDAVSDKIMALSLMLPLILVNPIIICNIVIELLISLFNVSGKLNGIDTKTVFTGKIKTWFLSLTLVLGYVSKFLPIFNKIFILFSGVTILMQAKTCREYVIKNSKNLDRVDTLEETENKDEVNKSSELEELRRERENLLASKIVVKEKNKVRKRKK